MKKTNCINCSSNDIVFEKGMWVCRACGSRFMPEADEIPQKTKVEELEDELCDICDEIENTNEFDISQSDHRDGLFDKLGKKADEIISINRDDPYAMTAKMLIQIYEGLRDRQCVNRFVDYIERAVDASDDEAKKNTWEVLAKHLDRFGPRVLEHDPALKGRVNRLIDVFGEYGVIMDWTNEDSSVKI